MSRTADRAPSQPDGEGVTPIGFKLVYTVRAAADVLCLGYSTVGADRFRRGAIIQRRRSPVGRR
jgi:hypothetical protein